MNVMDKYDIFETEKSGSLLWLGTAATLEEAQVRVQQLSARSPGNYLIFDPRTGAKFMVKSDSPPGGMVSK
jgi:hypothetical protein